MGLKAGSYNSFTNSMAEAMENAFQVEWNIAKDYVLPEAGEEDRKMLFAAIAQGVVNHLKDNINDALKIEVEVEQTSDSMITSTNGTVDVTQSNSASNRVESEGEAVNIELLTES